MRVPQEPWVAAKTHKDKTTKIKTHTHPLQTGNNLHVHQETLVHSIMVRPDRGMLRSL